MYIKSPQQASTIFGLNGPSAPRTKGQFYVCFKQNGTGSASSGWQNSMGFMVKSMDRPAIQPEIVEINQYNKKRQITTGYKVAPIKITLYDTADSMVMQMWSAYNQWYFGDFSQTDETSWSYDVTTMSMTDSGSGFGYQPQQASSDSADLNSQFFFSVIEVYQVFGGQYVQYDLINPKITAFDPDDLDYASGGDVSTITMSLAFEAVLYKNNGQPMAITSSDVLNAAFQGQFEGTSLEVPGAPTNQSLTTSTPNVTPMMLSNYNFNYNPGSSPGVNLTQGSGNTLGGGSLAQFGNYDFGSLSPSVSLGGGTAADVSYLASGNNNLSSLLNLPVGISPIISTPESLALGGGAALISSFNGASYDAAQGALTGAGAPDGSPYATSYIQNNLVGGTAASSLLSQNSPSDQLTGSDGLTLNSQTYGIVNAQNPTYSQIGFNSQGSSDYSVNGSQSTLAQAASPPIPSTGPQQTSLVSQTVEDMSVV